MNLSTCSTCEGLTPDHLARCPHCDDPLLPERRGLRTLARTLGGGAIAMTLMACYGAPAGYYPDTPTLAGDCTSMSEDVDGDGFCAEDCDEVNPSIHPGADDPPGDGYDQNCDGVDGTQGIDGGPGAPTSYAEPPPRDEPAVATDPPRTDVVVEAAP